MTNRNSRFPGFYKITVHERRELVAEATRGSIDEITAALETGWLGAQTAGELGQRIAEVGGGRPGLRILSNLCDRRRARVRATIPADVLATETLTGGLVIDGIVNASRFAEADPYRAATHNKGIMNGIDV